MGAVYRARDEVLDDEVALKILRPEVAGTPEMAARFRSEIKLARKVSHWNVCRIHEYGEDGALQYISMELVSGATLKDRLRDGPLPAAAAFDVAIQVAEGLSAIHKVGIVHRDLKSPNVMIDAEGTAKVMDFGIAKPAAAGTDPGASTGYVLGSPEYMSPEQARGRRAEFRSDLYSLGVVIFEAFTGRVPFRASTPVATLMMHVEAPPPIDDPGLGLPPALVPVLRRALAKDPEQRFRDAPEMAAALRAAREGAGGAAGAAAPGGSPTEVVHTRRLPMVTRRGGALALGGLAAIAAALVAALALRAREPAVVEPVPSPVPFASAATSPVPTETPPVLIASVAPSLAPASEPASSARAVPPPTTLPAVAPATPEPPAPSPVPVTTTTLPPVVVADTPPRASPVPSPPTTPAVGWLLVLPKPWADVMVDARMVGQAPLPKIPLSPGTHSVVLTNPAYKPFTRRVEIRAGEVTELRFDFAEEGVRTPR
jgi:serine/threonine-protein kinase